jgi:hypothetical protein
MHIIAVAALAIAVFLAALRLPSAPNATASYPGQVSASIDPHVMPSTVDMKSLPQ